MREKFIRTMCMFLCSGIIVFISTFIPSIYMPKLHSNIDLYNELHQQYQEIATTLGFDKDFFSNVVTKEDLSEPIDETQIQEKASLILKNEKQKGTYVLDEKLILQITDVMKEQYANITLQFHSDKIVKQFRMYSLYFCLGIGGMIVFVNMYSRRPI